VDNPDSESEMFLLRKYAPNISEDLLLKLTAAFKELRKLVDEGLISYPYSTRELVNIVKHMQVNTHVFRTNLIGLVINSLNYTIAIS